MEEAADPGGEDQTPGEPVRAGARQREAEPLERRSIQTTCEPPHVASVRFLHNRSQQLSHRLIFSRTDMSSVWCFLRATDL